MAPALARPRPPDCLSERPNGDSYRPPPSSRARPTAPGVAVGTPSLLQRLADARGADCGDEVLRDTLLASPLPSQTSV
jgi:hypothetical protein